MLTRVERNINDTLNRIERGLNERIARHEADDARLERTLVERINRNEVESNAKHASGITERVDFEKRLRVLEDTKMKGSGAWWVLAAFLGLLGTVGTFVVANTAMDELRATREKIWAAPAMKGHP